MVRVLCELALPAVVVAAEGMPSAPGFHHDLAAQLTSLREAVVALPIATLLGAILAFQPRRRATSRTIRTPRKPERARRPRKWAKLPSAPGVIRTPDLLIRSPAPT